MTKKWFGILPLLCLIACTTREFPLSPEANGIPLIIFLEQNKPGRAIPKTFEGLSLETEMLTKNPQFLTADNKVLTQLLKNLGPGVLRIGGDSSDEIPWTGKPRIAANTVQELTTTDIDRLAAFSKATKWPVIFGLNLGMYDPAIAADEAKYVSKSLGRNLYLFQAGNEPDVFEAKDGRRTAKYNYKAYQQEWDSYFAAVRTAVSDAPFAGPDFAYKSEWLREFAAGEYQNVKLLSGHYYRTGPASSPLITYRSLMNFDAIMYNALTTLKDASAKYHLPYRITECNNVYGGGKFGVSDTFGSSLWSLEVMWAAAENEAQGINFHTLSWGAYSPIVTEQGKITARPEYYGMLAFKYGSTGGTIIPANISEPTYDCTAHACANKDNTYSLTLINREHGKNFSFTVQLKKKASSIQVLRLVAPSVTAKSNVTFAGGKIAADGTFKEGSKERYKVDDMSFLVNVPAGSAAVVVIK